MKKIFITLAFDLAAGVLMGGFIFLLEFFFKRIGSITWQQAFWVTFLTNVARDFVWYPIKRAHKKKSSEYM